MSSQRNPGGYLLMALSRFRTGSAILIERKWLEVPRGHSSFSIHIGSLKDVATELK